MRNEHCERCPDEDTNKCNTCTGPNVQPVKITIEDALNYFVEENQRYKEILREKAILAIEYRMNLLAINALNKEILDMAAGL